MLQEIELGRNTSRILEAFRPDIVLSANTPLMTQWTLQRKASSCQASFIFWLQDLLGIGIKRNLNKRMPLFGNLLGGILCSLEQHLLLNSDAVVVITEDFVDYLPAKMRRSKNVSIVENWAPLEDMPLFSKENDWAVANGLANTTNLVYSGTLGLKHKPELLVRLAHRLKRRPAIRLVVVSEGYGANLLNEAKRRDGLTNLIVKNYQPFQTLPKVLASADILLGILDQQSSVFAVPSKVLSYLCTGIPIVLACPESNLAARIVHKSGAGIVVSPNDPKAFISHCEHLLELSHYYDSFAGKGNVYAQQHFDIRRVSETFTRIFKFCKTVPPPVFRAGRGRTER